MLMGECMFTTREIAEITGGVLCGADVEVGGVSTDTRTIKQGDLFVAVRGESFDGNDFIEKAAENGAAAAISDRAQGSACAIPVVYVKDSRAAQLKLSRAFRDRFGVWLCGVTGSVGKTSTKDMIHAVLSAKCDTLKTEGNFNNDIGLPKMLFRLNESFGAAVIEMGMSDLGEISALSKAAHPDCAVITNIGWCHIENLGSQENILKAKLEILDGAKEGAALILNGDDEFLSTVTPERAGGRRLVHFGFGAGNDVRAENILHTEDGERFELVADGKRYPAELNVLGEHHIINALAAFCVGKEAGMSPEEIIPAFLRYEASGMRQKIEQRGDITVILDCYNASPTSMNSSLSVLGRMKTSGRRIAVLGDMLELGAVSEKLHAKVAEYILDNADEAFLFGKEMAACAAALSEKNFPVVHSEDKAALTERLLTELRGGDCVLFKGSHGMHMEEIAEKIQ